MNEEPASQKPSAPKKKAKPLVTTLDSSDKPLGCIDRIVLMLLGLIMAGFFGWFTFLLLPSQGGSHHSIGSFILQETVLATFGSIALFNGGMVLIMILGPQHKLTQWTAHKGQKAFLLIFVFLMILFGTAIFSWLFP